MEQTKETIKWHDVTKEKPTETGVYIVARFEGDKMIEWNTNYCCYEGNLMPNYVFSPYIGVTHWLSYAEYRRIMELTERL